MTSYHEIGFAVVVDGQILMRTVSDSRRAAIVNFLEVDEGRVITNATTDPEIAQMWASRRKTMADVRIVNVTLGAKQ